MNEFWTEMEESLKVPMTVEHYNALLSVYVDNGHQFCPEHVSYYLIDILLVLLTQKKKINFRRMFLLSNFT